MTSNQVDISKVKFHNSHSKETRKQLLSRIILAQRPCHKTIKAFRSILTIAMCRCTIITLLLDFNFDVLILEEDFNPKICSTFFFNREIFRLVARFASLSDFFIQLSSQTVHVIFPWFTGSHVRNIRSLCNIQNEI